MKVQRRKLPGRPSNWVPKEEYDPPGKYKPSPEPEAPTNEVLAQIRKLVGEDAVLLPLPFGQKGSPAGRKSPAPTRKR
jgi:hypothetical protein